MERKIEFSVGEFYHIYNRGVDKRKVFLHTVDYQRFLLLLYLANTTDSVHFGNLRKQYRGEPSFQMFNHSRSNTLVAIGAYCLMPNHFHLLLKETTEGGISKFMLKLQTAYSMYFNVKNERSGALVQGMFKSEHVDDDDYLKYLYSYIHLNPAKLIDSNWKKKILSEEAISDLHDYAKNYPYSSYKLFLSRISLPASSILERREFPEYFVSPVEFEEEILDWLSWNEGSPRSGTGV